MEKVFYIAVSGTHDKPEVSFYPEESWAKDIYENMINLRKKYAKASKEHSSDPDYDCSYSEKITTSSNGDELFSEERVFTLTESGGEYEDSWTGTEYIVLHIGYPSRYVRSNEKYIQALESLGLDE